MTLPKAGLTRDTPWLSILIPAYNVELYLEECLDSVLEQAGPDVEIIVCDDASTDRTHAIAQHYLARYPARLTVLNNASNSGLSATRNRMIDAARGEYLWFLDSDDTILPGAISAIARVAALYNPDIIGGDYRKRRMYKRAFTGRRETVLTDPDIFLAKILESRKIYAWLRISKRGLWNGGLRFPDGKVFEDIGTMPYLILSAQTYYHLSRALIQYRIRPGSILAGITRTPGSFRVDKHLDLAHALDGFGAALAKAEKHQPFSETRFAVSHFIAMEFCKIAGRIRKAGPSGCDVQDTSILIEQFRSIMEGASPLPFPTILAAYIKRGKLIAYAMLRREGG
ncbi:glycosyltransferase family 2 protein [Pontixanthobacter sp.]|uniref:glycosyltransferase family 2 protein n=1 Tax=Pontixanthobacter sp. TaxID=2792078 RepID=UPI003C7D7920